MNVGSSIFGILLSALINPVELCCSLIYLNTWENSCKQMNEPMSGWNSHSGEFVGYLLHIIYSRRVWYDLYRSIHISRRAWCDVISENRTRFSHSSISSISGFLVYIFGAHSMVIHNGIKYWGTWNRKAPIFKTWLFMILSAGRPTNESLNHFHVWSAGLIW